MIVYRDQRSPADSHRLLLQLQSAVRRFCVSAPSHDEAVELVIQAGILESAVADALFPDCDGIHPIARLLRQASVEAGHMLWHTWHGNHQQAGRWGSFLELTLGHVRADQLPRRVTVSVPEGYAYYAVYPEMYLEAAKRFAADAGSRHAVCLGIRSIGASLSAVVAAALAELGVEVTSWTLRPRGHPFSRRPCVSEELASQLQRIPGANFLVIDEGPGISGSSLGGTAALLQGWGIPNEQVLLFPSWQTDGRHLLSTEAREQWGRHRQFTASFEEVWLESGRFGEAFPGDLRDVSAGAWREEVYRDLADYPAVQPQHERRKYLFTSQGRSHKRDLLSFAGLGHGPAQKVERLGLLADAGFTVPPERLDHGFLVRPFVTGIPVSSNRVDSELLERVAAYLAHLCQDHSADPTVDDESLREMIAVNVGEGLQLPSAAPLRAALPASSWVERPVKLDGRMLAHEWVRTATDIFKLDAMDHHDDHFFPGCQDIAWDVAGAVFELDLAGPSRTYLVERYRQLSGDSSIARRLPHYAIAYLSFRMGYATLAGSVLGRTDDGARFTCQANRYAGLLTTRLNASPAEWNV